MVYLVNKRYNAMRRRAGKTVIDPIPGVFDEYTVRHLKEEEQLTAKAGYAELECHKRLHEELVGQVMEFKNQFKSGSATVTMDLMNFISDWLVKPIKGEDRKYVTLLKGGADHRASMGQLITGLIREKGIRMISPLNGF